MNFELLLLQFSYIGIFLLMFLNGIFGFPSSQLIYVLAGWFAYRGELNFWVVISIGVLGQVLGNILLYELSRRKGLKYILSIDNFLSNNLKLSIFSEKEIKKIMLVMKKKGLIYLFFGKLINPIKIIINIPAGMSKINRFYFNVIILITSFIWAFAFTYLGFAFGKGFEFAIYYGLFMILASATILYFFHKSMNSKEIVKEIEN